MHSSLENIHKELGIGAEHLTTCKLDLCSEPPLRDLEVVDIDFEGRPFILHRVAAKAWRQMSSAAAKERVELRPFSGFRSYVHQKHLIKRKLEKGRSLSIILTETAIPGNSEHHSGCAVDICTPEKFDLSEAFETSTEFAWLKANAAQFSFGLSYPRKNERGIVYEPWHWFFEEAQYG